MTTATATNPQATPHPALPTLPVYRIDPAHSEASFRVRHLLSHVRGRFRSFAGELRFDPADAERSSVTFTIEAASIDTDQPDRDAHLRSSDFFDAEKYPALTFESREVIRTGENTFDVIGDLTIRGVTHRISLPVTYLGEITDPWGVRKVAFEAETTLNRKDFGLTWNLALETGGLLVGDEVRVTLSIQATEAK